MNVPCSKSPAAFFVLLLGVSAALFCASLFFGAARVSPWTEEGLWILRELRFPRALLAFAVGASLAAAGSVLQALFRNPLADPHLTGVSAGGAAAVVLASLGAVSWSGFTGSLPLICAAGSLAALAAVVRLGRRGGVLSVTTLLLAGVMVNSFLVALIVFLQSIRRSEEMEGVLFWLLGSLGSAPASQGWQVCAVLLAGSAVLLSQAKALNLIAAGEGRAQALGVPVEKTKILLFAVTALLTGAAVSASGMIGFVGLIAPHLARFRTGQDYRLLIPASLLTGGSLLLLSDLLARTIFSPQEIPVGVLTAFLGVPFFLRLLHHSGAKPGVQR